jgi:hypothetical protein
MEIAANTMAYVKEYGPVLILVVNAFAAWRWRSRLDKRLLNIIALLRVHRSGSLQRTTTMLERGDV